ncbi:MAG: hypothetical protein GQE15_27550 [Archangiaceae bacterium]|nr:hypothetical protein [Archangiaceae bacterium]
MSKLLPLKKGSVLVVRADRVTMEQGQTNPFELEKLVKRGVRVFPLRNLHAKIFVFSDFAVVGSMNASTLSWDGGVIEAGVEFTGRAVGNARSQVMRWASNAPLDKDDLKELKSQYKPRAGVGRRTGSKAPRVAEMDLPVLRVLRTVRRDWEDHTHDRFNRESPALRKAAARQGETLEAIEWDGKVVEVGPDEKALEICEERDGSVWIAAPARVRQVSPTKHGHPEKLVYLSRAVGVKRRRMTEVAKSLGAGSQLVKRLRAGGRVFKDRSELERIYRLWRVRK